MSGHPSSSRLPGMMTDGGCQACERYADRSYGVVAADREVRYDHGRGADVRTLYVTGNNLDRHPDERRALQRWLAGVNPDSSHFCPS